MNKKTYILSFVSIALLCGVVWYGSHNEGSIVNQAASILGDNQEKVSGSAILSEEMPGDFILGNPEAKVTMIEYSSHFCGHCANFHKDTLPLLVDKYIKTGQVKLISRYVSPPEIVMSIICAQEEDKFSEMSERFFEKVQEIDFEDVDWKIKFANEIKPTAFQVISNQENFNECYDSGRYFDIAEEWYLQVAEAQMGTPTFFINDQTIVGNQPMIVFEEAIERALEQ